MIDMKWFDDGQMRGYTYRDNFMDMLKSEIDGFVTPSGHSLSICLGPHVFGEGDCSLMEMHLQDDYDVIDDIVIALFNTLKDDTPSYLLDEVTCDLIKHVVYYTVTLLRQLKIQDVVDATDSVLLRVFVHRNKVELSTQSKEFIHLYKIEIS